MAKDLLSNLKDICETAVQVVDQGINEISRQLNNDIPMIRIPFSAQDYYRKNYEQVFDEMEAYGFKEIVLLEQKDLRMGLLTRQGSVESISIDGKADFKKNQRFKETARVIITYHTFED